MPDYQLLAVDVDGTLVDGTLEIRPRNLEALQSLLARDIHVVLATGRMYASTLRYAETVGTTAPLICYQGAMVRGVDGESLREWPISPGAARACVNFAREHDLHVNLYYDDRFYVEQQGEGARKYAAIAQLEPVVVPDLTEIAVHGSTKAVFVGDHDQLVQLQPQLKRLVSPEARVTFSLPDFLEVVNAQADKGRALGFVANRLGVPATRIVAAGDAPNDIEMLRFAGLAVAPTTASPEALALAAATIPAPNDDGIAELVARYF